MSVLSFNESAPDSFGFVLDQCDTQCDFHMNTGEICQLCLNFALKVDGVFFVCFFPSQVMI